MIVLFICFFFFFQAEDGIRDLTVTGVRTCALPISPFLNLGARPRVAVLREQGVNSHVEMAYAFTEAGFDAVDVHMTDLQSGRAQLQDFAGVVRSEERRVGKECRSRWSPYH